VYPKHKKGGEWPIVDNSYQGRPGWHSWAGGGQTRITRETAPAWGKQGEGQGGGSSLLTESPEEWRIQRNTGNGFAGAGDAFFIIVKGGSKRFTHWERRSTVGVLEEEINPEREKQGYQSKFIYM